MHLKKSIMGLPVRPFKSCNKWIPACKDYWRWKSLYFEYWLNTYTPIEKRSNQDWNTSIHLKNHDPHINVPLIFWFLIMTFNLCFYHQVRDKWVCIHIGDNYGHIGYLTLNKMLIKLTFLIICLINDNLTNTSSTPPPEVKKNSTVYSAFNNFVYLNRNSHLLEI